MLKITKEQQELLDYFVTNCVWENEDEEKISNSFICPNCGEKMEFIKQIQFDGDYYDKWCCGECPLIVLDWRSEEDE